MKETKKQPSKGLYLLPNLFTTSALFAGFYAITGAINEHFEISVIAIFIAMVLDGLDGRVARMTNTQSEFGAQYDSLADLVSFGVAPAALAYSWGLSSFGKFGWIVAFVYATCGALRLARFNVQHSTADKRYFQGLASPAAAALVAGYIWLMEDYQLSGTVETIGLSLVTLCAGLLMVSNIRYHSFKELNFTGKVPFVVAVIVMLVLALIYAAPPLVLFIVCLAYALSGIALTMSLLRRRRREKKVETPE
ncbi:MAG: CDP-diacylglycerol--serine O-phosphatidyltransferase [Cycloclasticus sp.]|jgi:CDP-diacylglycerol--serine O-phosphatidyltransferase|nr:MAG: CDP-diacylglycerol--serine O-phosphatidyltransferase [Cycloclasticus sp. Phe_18]MBV1913232.1 CDP-diacylglycerol--serine O-phosphatidyltransferase [Cycloclasticus sp.]MDF1689884.1 CDP-diacylglycerol--serine O-phosphatidyltransferase [Cycloclasticus sp.]MEE4291148.1 CDP-diacylglycerol--serine O-phosphatidyltransferase [Cycloclasticus sp.]